MNWLKDKFYSVFEAIVWAIVSFWDEVLDAWEGL